MAVLYKQRPTGLVSMLFTDIEGSTRLARALGDRWPEVLMAHHSILHDAIEGAGGHVEHTEGDAFFAVFVDADAAVAAAQTAQRALRAHDWPQGTVEVRVRMGIHTAHVDRVNGECIGLEVHRAARVGAAANGGQVIVTAATRSSLLVPTPCDDLGDHRLKDFPEPTTLFHLRMGERSARDFPPPKTLDVRPTNLPPSNTLLIGREAEVGAVRDVLLSGGARVVTLTGLGGAGKTTTALAAARSLLDDYIGGVWMVRAERLSDADHLVAAIAETLWLQDLPGGDLLQAVMDRLSDRNILLLLDNLEQVDGASQVIADIVARAQSVGVLATSRAPLGLAQERVIALGPLALDAAADLLCRRAEAVGALVDPDAIASVRELCERLGRFPLAIDLVAPRLRLFSPYELLDRLGPVVDLASASLDRPERQRSVRTTIEWSVALLDEAPRALFRRLAVFQSPAPVDVVDEVCCWDIDLVDGLSALLDYSLVHRAPSGVSFATAVRDVAAELLVASGEDHDVRRSHAIAMAALADRVRFWSATREDLETEKTLRADAWAATEWARFRDPAVHRKLLIGLGAKWAVSGQLRRALEEIVIALGNATISSTERGILTRLRAYLFLVAGDVAEAEAAAEEAVRLLEHAPLADKGLSFVTLSQVKCLARRGSTAVDAARTGVSLFRQLADASFLVRGLMELCESELIVGNFEAAGSVLREAERLVDTKFPEQRLMTLGARADWAVASGDFQAAIEANAKCLDEHNHYNAWAIAGLSEAFSQIGDAAAALELGAIATAMASEIGTDVESLTQFGSGVKASMARAREALTVDNARAAERAGQELPAGQRLVRSRELASRISSTHDVRR